MRSSEKNCKIQEKRIKKEYQVELKLELRESYGLALGQIMYCLPGKKFMRIRPTLNVNNSTLPTIYREPFGLK